MEGSVTQEWLDQYKLILGLSVTEMEIVHAAYRRNNPNGQIILQLRFNRLLWSLLQYVGYLYGQVSGARVGQFLICFLLSLFRL